MTRKAHLASSLLVGVSALAFASMASAHAPTAMYGQDDQDNSGGSAVDDIVVTGSRIVRNGNNSPTPVTVVSPTELLQTSPSTVVQALQELPVFSGGRSSEAPYRIDGSVGCIASFIIREAPKLIW
jgi:iron complex outermembrane receptor protein